MFGTIGRAKTAYFDKVNAAGGIDGRKINLISLDDGYAPPRTVSGTRKLVEQDEVLALFSSLGTPTNTAIHKYVNARSCRTSRVDRRFQVGRRSNFLDHGLGARATCRRAVYAKYILKSYPRARIAVLYQNDDFGKDFLKGFQTAAATAATSPRSSLHRPPMSRPTRPWIRRSRC